MKHRMLMAASLILAGLPLASPAGEVELVFSFFARPYEDIETRGETRFLSPDSLLAEGGLKLTWQAGETVDVKGIPVLVDMKNKRLQFRTHSDSLKVWFGELEGPPQLGNFAINAPFRLTGEGVMLKLNDGRYSYAQDEMRLALAGASWKRSLRGFLMAGLIGLLTLALLIRARNTRRRLESGRRTAHRRP